MGQPLSHQINDSGETNSAEIIHALTQLDTQIAEYEDRINNIASRLWATGLKKYEQRKQALTELRQHVLDNLITEGHADSVQMVEIDGQSLYAISVDGTLFYVPVSIPDDSVTKPVENPEFSSKNTTGLPQNTTPEHDLTERETLEILSSQFKSPNYYLDDPFEQNDGDDPFVGWPYLPGVVEYGQKVPDWLLDTHLELGEFIFDIGDRFETVKGHCEITDRYYAYLSPWMKQSPIKPLPVYDVCLAGEKRENVRGGEIIDDWCIYADSISDPLPQVNGTFGEIAGNATANTDAYSEVLEIGGLFGVNSEQSDAGTEWYKLESVYVSGHSLLGKCVGVRDTSKDEFVDNIQNIAEDTVAIF